MAQADGCVPKRMCSLTAVQRSFAKCRQQTTTTGFSERGVSTPTASLNAVRRVLQRFKAYLKALTRLNPPYLATHLFLAELNESSVHSVKQSSIFIWRGRTKGRVGRRTSDMRQYGSRVLEALSLFGEFARACLFHRLA
jgi:hypothetical protein